ncbi:MAG: extracellular solute-binding protein [Treponema sp.]|jgi:putative aldouronate transport system substrate-binding protein|nr:extracellular solute-binding protein [Treponema sp.]
MKQMKKAAALLLAALLAALLVFALAACGKSQGGTGKRVTIKVEVYDRGTDGGRTNPTNNKWTEWIAKKLLEDENIVVKFEPIPRAQEDQALINLMAAGNPPDVCMTYGGNNITDWAEQGGIFDLSPYIDTTLKDLKAFLGPDPALPGRDLIRRSMDAQTGKVWSMPAKRMNLARLNVFMRKDWLDKLGMAVPTTTQEFYNALLAFKEKDPGNAGRNNVIPYIMTTDARWTAGSILESFIDPNISAADRWVNTIIDRYYLLPGYKEGVRFVNKMFNAGLIDKDFPLYRDEETLKNLIKSGVVGSFGHNWDQIFRESERLFSDLRKNVPEAEWIAVDCMTSSDGITHKISYDPAGVNYFIPASSKNPDAAMRYLNWLAKYENYHFIQTGPEGIVHTLVDGVPKINPAAPDGWIQNSAQNIDYTPIMNGLFLKTEEESIRALAAGYPWPAEMVMAAFNISMNNAKPGPVITTSAPLKAAGPLNQTLVDKSNTFIVQAIIAPAANFDRVYDEGIADWLSSGAREVRDERREKYVNP